MQMKQDRMSGRERLEALFHYRRPDRVPIGPQGTGFATRNAGYTVADAYENPEKSFQAMLWTYEQYGWDPVPHYSGHTIIGAWEFGGDVKIPRGEFEGALSVKSSPVENEGDVDKLTLPDPRNAGRIPVAMRFSQLQKEQDLPVYFFSRSPFCVAASICRLDVFLRWTVRKPELCHRLLRVSLQFILNVLTYWVDTFGAESVFVWMSSPTESNQLVSPKTVEQFALPYHLEYQQKIRSLGIRRFGLHMCGDQNMNLPVFASAAPWQHPSVLSFGHEVDLETAARHFPQDILFGNIEPAILQTGTPQRVYDLSRAAIEKGKKAPGGFILGPGCGIPVYAPPVNVYAMTKAVHDFGWYEDG
jgi:uroporphyrinogen decarboxylase